MNQPIHNQGKKQWLVSFLFFVLFVCILFTSVYGVYLPEDTLSFPVGRMLIGTFHNGLSFFESDRGYYYTFSPFNDYVINPDGSHTAFISQKELAQNSYITDIGVSHWYDIWQTIHAYTVGQSPSVTFVTHDKKNGFSYQSDITNNKATVFRKIYFNGDTTQKQLGLTLTFQSTDIVYDKEYNLYTYPLEDDLSMFETLYNIRLTPNRDMLRTQISDGVLIIVNPSISSTMVIKAQKNQKIYVNRDAKLIEIEESVNPTNKYYTTSLQMNVYTNPKEAHQTI
jgi:hypothetical protein